MDSGGPCREQKNLKKETGEEGTRGTEGRWFRFTWPEMAYIKCQKSRGSEKPCGAWDLKGGKGREQ